MAVVGDPDDRRSGTGKLLGKDDISDASVGNTLYVIRDGTIRTPEPAPTTPYSRSDLNSVDGTRMHADTSARHSRPSGP